MQKIKKGDTVQVISTKHKGAIGVVERREGDYVFVQGVNILKRASKEQKSYIEKTHPIHVSNVQYYDAESKIASRVRIITDEKTGKKQRQLVKNSKIISK